MRKYRKTRKEKRKQRKILIITSLSLLLFLCVGYAAFSTNLSITAKGNVKEKSRVIQSWSNTDQTDFHSDFYKENIVSVTFLDNNNVPSNANESWNVSEDKEHGGVLAWVIPNNNDNTKYDLYIGAKDGVIANENSSNLFYNFQNVKEINFNNNFNTSNVNDMAGMFSGNNNIETLDLSSFDTKNVTNMAGMFSAYDFGNVIWGHNSLTNIIFGENFDTSNVIDMSDMFSGTQVTSLDLNKFNTANVLNMYHMFNQCQKLEILYLCSFDTAKTTRMVEMFTTTTNLKQVYVGSKWITSQADTTNMFLNSGVSQVTTGQC